MQYEQISMSFRNNCAMSSLASERIFRKAERLRKAVEGKWGWTTDARHNWDIKIRFAAIRKSAPYVTEKAISLCKIDWNESLAGTCLRWKRDFATKHFRNADRRTVLRHQRQIEIVNKPQLNAIEWLCAK